MPHAEVEALTRSLVAIDATNPSLVPGGAGERELAEAIGAWLDDRGFDVRLVGADPARPSVLARRQGTGGGRTLMLAGHLDTVGGSGAGAVSAGAAPDADRIVGRGAYDMAGGLAAAMVAAAAAPAGLAGDLVLAFAADEEFGSVGMEELLAAIDAEAGASVDPWPRPDAAVVLEPTDLGVTLAHRGFAWYRVEYDGLAAHGSQPELGLDAIESAIDGLLALRALATEIGARPRHPLLGAGSVRVRRSTAAPTPRPSPTGAFSSSNDVPCLVNPIRAKNSTACSRRRGRRASFGWWRGRRWRPMRTRRSPERCSRPSSVRRARPRCVAAIHGGPTRG